MIKNMKTFKTKNTTKLALYAGAAALASFAPQLHAQSSDALIDKLVDKGILTTDEAKDLRDQADNDFKTAFQTKTGMPDWVTGYKITGSFRARFDKVAGDNQNEIERDRYRYRLLFGLTVNMMDNLEAGFRLGSGDPQGSAGNPLSQNTTLTGNWSDKNIYIDVAYGKWTILNGGNWLLAATAGKMENPFTFTPMVFDADLTPEGMVVQGSYTVNDKHTIVYSAGGFVLQEVKTSMRDPFLYGGQVALNSKWTDKWASSVGVGAFAVGNPQQLTTPANALLINQGNTRDVTGNLVNKYEPVIADASVTYTADTFPFYTGAFPIKLQGEYMQNPGAALGNMGYWTGIIFGKSGNKRTWDLTYRYEYLQADAWYDQLVDDDNGAYYATPNYANNTAAKGWASGTNIRGHMVKFNYSFTDSLTFTVACFINDLITRPPQNTSPNQVDLTSSALHFYADVLWKF